MLGLAGPRTLTLLALVLAAVLLLAWVPDGLAPALLTPAVVTGFVFGSGDLLCLASVLAGAWLARQEQWLAAGAALGVGAALAPQVLFVAPLLLAPAARARATAVRAALGAALGLLVPLSLAMIAGGFALSVPLAPGLGLTNLAIYFGAERGGAAWWLPAVAVLGVGVALAPCLAARPEAERWAAAAALLLAGLWLLPGASPHEIATPLALLATAGARFDTPSTRP